MADQLATVAMASLASACMGGAAPTTAGSTANGHGLDARTEGTPARCGNIARSLAAGHVVDLGPLPPDCPLESVLGAVPGLGERGSAGSIGDGSSSTDWREVTQGIAGEVFRVWSEGDRIVALELEEPKLVDSWSTLRAWLGPPDAALDYYEGMMAVPGSQWVFATYGVALFTWNGDEPIGRVVVFPPTTAEHYRTHLAMNTEPDREEGYYH